MRILDVITSSILARPFASVSTRPETSTEGQTNDHPLISRLAVNANFELCTLIESILRRISQKPSLDVVSTQGLLRQLNQWSNDLPLETRLCSIGITTMSADHEKALGSIHVACMYYFAVMLLTRPFLIQHLMSRLPNLSEPREETIDLEASPEVTKLAYVCIDAAMFTAHICHNALTAGLFLDNMCILK
jgi:hypothetical protein